MTPSSEPSASWIDTYPALSAARYASLQRLAQVRGLLAPLADQVPGLLAVSASGSLGRHEAGPHSDTDLIVVIEESKTPDRVMGAVWEAMGPSGLPMPKASGIYASPVPRVALVDPSTIGQVVEDVAVFGKRIQLLLDAQPLFGDAGHRELQRDILARYTLGMGDFSFLRHDLIRYYRCLCLEAQADFGPRNGGWYVRQLKLRHSRLLMVAALLFLLGRGGELVPDLAQTPLERIALLYRACSDPGFVRLATAYDRILAGLNDPGVRAKLAAAAPKGFHDLRTPPTVYTGLWQACRELSAELVRFLLTRRQDWGDEFVENLVF